MRTPPLERFALWILRRRTPSTPEGRVMLDMHADVLTAERLAKDARERLRLAVIDAKVANMLHMDEGEGASQWD